jgi:hypothetical protein
VPFEPVEAAGTPMAMGFIIAVLVVLLLLGVVVYVWRRA